MRRWQFTIAISLAAVAGGCQADNLRMANIALERENFQLEQRLDAVQWELDDTRAALDSCRCGAGAQNGMPLPPPTFRSPLRNDDSAPRDSSPDRAPPLRNNNNSNGNQGPSGDRGPAVDRPPDVQLPFEETRRRQRRETAPPFSGPPQISPPRTDVPDGTRREGPRATPVSVSRSAPSAAPMSEAPRFNGAAAVSETRQREEPNEAPAYSGPDNSANVGSLVINPALTAWHKTSAGADGGLRVVVEPHDAANQLIHAGGDVAIVVLDPSQSGAASRIARWDFSAAETARHARGTGEEGGLHFKLNWPSGPPAISELLLFVRLTTPDGQQFVAEQALQPSAGNEAVTWDNAPAAPEAASGPDPQPATRWRRATTPMVARRAPPSNAAPAQMLPTGAREPAADFNESNEFGPSADSGPTLNSGSSGAWQPYR